MIIESLFNGIYSLFFDVLFNFTIPPLDVLNDIVSFVDTLIEYGMNVYKFFIPPAGQVMLTIVIASEVVVEGYFFIMWIIKKIPMLSVD